MIYEFRVFQRTIAIKWAEVFWLWYMNVGEKVMHCCEVNIGYFRIVV